MKMIKTILLMAIVASPAISLAQNYHSERSQRQEQWGPSNLQEPSFDYYERRDPRHHDQRHQQPKQKHKARKTVQAGWDVDPRIAQYAPNCYPYTLSAQGGKGSARITSIPGKNYIQVNGQKSGYVCFQRGATLELGKLANPGIKVKFNLKGIGSYGFARGNSGSSYKNNWYRSYWGL